MKFGNDSSVNIENHGCNQGVQVGINSGNITVNQRTPPDEMKDIITSVAEELEKRRHKDTDSHLHESTPQKQKWFRSDTGEEVLPTQLIKSNNITAQLDGAMGRIETTLENGKTMYAEFDIDKDEATNIVSEGFPQEYTVKIPSNIVINSVQFIVKDGENTYRIEKYQLKFGGYLLAIYDVGNNKLQGLQAKAPAGMKTNVNPKLQIITFVSDGTIM